MEIIISVCEGGRASKPLEFYNKVFQLNQRLSIKNRWLPGRVVKKFRALRSYFTRTSPLSVNTQMTIALQSQ